MKIAIIGGIGSGKSEVLKVAREMGIACLSADEINSELLTQPEYIAEIAEEFPTAVADGGIDRAALASIVFADDEKRERLNSIAHPRILARIAEEDAPLLVVEIPLLLETGAQRKFDFIVFVHTSVEERIERLKGRGMSADEAEARMRAQADELTLLAAADRIIENSDGIEDLKRSAQKLFSDIIAEMSDGESA